MGAQHQNQIDQLTARLDRLEAENDRLKHRLDSTGENDSHDGASAQAADISKNTQQMLTRRRLMLAGGAAAAGAVAATASATPAAAGGATSFILKNAPNGVSAPTSLSGAIMEGGSTNIFSSSFFANNTHPTMGTALYGVAQSFGVSGLASDNSGTGVFGRSEAGNVGVHGFTYGNPATDPASQFTAGVWGQISTSYPTAPAFLADGGITLRTLENPGGEPASVGAKPGDLSIRSEADGTSTWWVCVKDDSDGDDAEFVRVASQGSAGAFETLAAPIRVYDSRVGSLPATGPKIVLAGGTERTVDCSANTSGAVPSDAKAVLINLTAISRVGTGFMAAIPGDGVYANTSNLNFTEGQVVANAVTVGCGPGATIKLRAQEVGVTVDAIVDVAGFYR